ncbi:MAG: hypothetical protein ABEJ56_05740 [Candidatus Nanohaloarchaea archaeon]
MSEKELIYLFDLTRGRQGTLDEIVETNEKGFDIEPSNDAKVDEVVKVSFYPSQTPNKGFRQWLKTILPFTDTSRVTQEKFPKSAVEKFALPSSISDYPGAPDKICVISERETGARDLAEMIDAQIDNKVSSLQQRKEEAETETQRKDFENLDQKQEDDDEYERGRGRDRGLFEDDYDRRDEVVR